MEDEISYCVFGFDTREDYHSFEFEQDHYSEFETLEEAREYFDIAKHHVGFCVCLYKYEPGTDYEDIATCFVPNKERI